jgi:hypothetical protein
MVTRLESSFVGLLITGNLICAQYAFMDRYELTPLPVQMDAYFHQRCTVWYMCNTMQRTKKQGPG